ncbi:d-ala d-ala ligase c-terminus [Lucifera butyrica]|uniref:Cyanophycin synthetase n=1 Tax=Lucifera butyrica TaxID=1351585 RepID=A0A498R8U4_9FIRM|nr:cyanophycin synthetase [Lucifera butyrica]VBB06563.1 d-ala d-ala ligase c-terminus [Lucifera butyrica]
MQVLSVRVLEGPNVYSYRPVLRVMLDIGEYENIPSNAIDGFIDRVLELLPGLQTHCCSRGREGGFVERLAEGTYLGHIFEHVALEIQNLAGYDVRFGKTRHSGRDGVYDVIIGYSVQAAAMQTVAETEKLLLAVLGRQEFSLSEAVNKVRAAAERYQLGPSTQAIYEAAVKRNIPVTRIGAENLLVLGYGCRQQRIWATITGKTGALAADLACDKYLTNQFLVNNGIPVPFSLLVEDAAQAVRAWQQIGGCVAVKPLSSNQGKGVTVKINSAAEVEQAFAVASQYDRRVLVEEYITGRQYRLCIVGYKMVAASERIPAYVMGDGVHNVAELVNRVNEDPRRGEYHEKPLTKIKLDDIARMVLDKQQFTGASVPAAGQVVYLRESANLSTGGTAVDVTDIVHPDNARLVERAARIVGLDIAGIDVVAQDIARPISRENGAIIEINAAPGIRMHHFPYAGKPRDVAGAIVDHLFPAAGSGRIPITAITGTNGKTTVTRMISHIWQLAGYKVGMATTEGIYIDGYCVERGDTTGPRSSRNVLTDPLVEAAVLEVARGGIVRGGLAFDTCDVGIITNITEDHFGQDGIEDLEDLSYLKSLIIETVKPEGAAILNADDPYVVSLLPRARGEIVFSSIYPDNIVVRRHLGAGGKAFLVKDHIIYAACGSLARPVIHVADIPVTMGGIATHNVQNAVIAAAACYSYNIPLAYIRKGLSTFEHNPGRLTVETFGQFRVCVDYGHNPAGYQALLATAGRMGASRLVGVIGAPGDRRNDVLLHIGRIAGQGFDVIYIKEDADLRGRAPGEVAVLLQQGALDSMAPEKMHIVLEEGQAVLAALQAAKAGDLIIVFYEKYDRIMKVIQEFRQREEMVSLPSQPVDQVIVASGSIL